MPSRQSEPPIITLTTDFGTADTYVGQMKGVILGINPHARIVDITHAVRPQQIAQAAFRTQAAWPAFPDGTIHIAVVDPGVGTERRALLLETPHGRFIGPDNGVLSAALPEEARPAEPSMIALPGDCRVIEITNTAHMRQPTSATFHGRDIFSPTAAWLSRGLDVEEFGERIDSMYAFPPFRARRGGDGTMMGRVVDIDVYGNVITDIHGADLPEGRFTLDVDGHVLPGPYRTFAKLDGPGAIVGSSGFLGIAAPNGNAAELLGVDIGAAAVLRFET